MTTRSPNRSALVTTEVARRHRPFKTLSEIDYALMEWRGRYNNARLYSRPD